MQKLYAQSLFCLEEIVLIYPQAYNIFARMGEISYLLSIHQTSTSGRDNDNATEVLLDAQRYYLRSIELCEDYPRGYYGLVVVCGRLLKVGNFGGEKVMMGKGKVESLYERARARLAEIVTRAKRRERGWEGYDAGEVEAARRLLEEEEEVGGQKMRF